MTTIDTPYSHSGAWDKAAGYSARAMLPACGATQAAGGWGT